MDFTNTKLANFIEDKRRLPRPKKRPVFNKGGHKHGERRKKSVTIFDSGKHKDNYEVYDERKDKWVSARNFKEDYDLDETMRIPRSVNASKWQNDVDKDAKKNGINKTATQDKLRQQHADRLRRTKKGPGGAYAIGKNTISFHNRIGQNSKRQGYVEDIDLDELIDGIMDETKRIPHAISGKRKWRQKVANDAKESGRDTETVNKEHRKSLADSLRNSKKAKGARYEDGKWHNLNHKRIGMTMGHVESFQPLSASDALLILQEKKTYYSRCKCRGKCDCEAKMKARREAKKNQIKESALVLYGKYYNTNITEPTIAEQFKKRIDYCIANERDFDFLQSNIYVELFESLINERQQDYDAFISDVEPQEDDLYKEAFTDEHVNNIVDEMFASETIDNLMDKRAEEEIAYINDNYKQKLKMMGLL